MLTVLGARIDGRAGGKSTGGRRASSLRPRLPNAECTRSSRHRSDGPYSCRGARRVYCD